LGATMPAFSRVFTTDAHVLNVINSLIPVCHALHISNSFFWIMYAVRPY
jgi:hypothetical protein